MAAIKFSKQSIQPNPMEVDYWVDITSNPYGGNIKYFNGYDWVDLLNAKGKPVNLDAYYNKLQMNQMLAGKASVESVNSKVDDTEVADVIKNIEFKDRGDEGVEMVVLKYDGMTVGVTLPTASNTTSGIITNKSFKDLVKQNQLQGVYSEMYDKLSEIRQQYQRKLKAGKNIQIDENNTIHAVGEISLDWNDVYNKPDFDKLFASVALAIQSESNRAKNAEQQLSARITDHVDVVEGKLELKADANNVYTKEQIDEKISGIYKIKGSRTFQDLPTSGNSIGDVYNITNNFALDGVEYPFGTNVVYTATGWDALAGIFDSTEIENKVDEIDTKVDEEVIRAKEKELELDKKFDDYLPLSGGTIVGLSTAFRIKRNTNNPSLISFLNTTGPLGGLGMDTQNIPAFFDYDLTNVYRLLHEGNYSDYALPLTGGTVTGKTKIETNSSVPLHIASSEDTTGIQISSINGSGYLLYKGDSNYYVTDRGWYNKYKIWHEGNDGEGSGLDADTLDGKHLDMLMYYNAKNDNLSDSTKGNKIIRLSGSAESDAPYGYGDILQWTGRPLNDTNNNDKGNYYHLLYSTANSGLYYRNKFSSNSWNPWKTIAFTDSDITGNSAGSPILIGTELNENQDLNNLASWSGIKFWKKIPDSTANAPIFSNWANSMLQIPLHGSSSKYAQLYFSSGNPLYYRSEHTADWKQIATTDYNGFYDLTGGLVINASLENIIDLNNYKTIGTYVIHSAGTAKYITNCPISEGAFTLVVSKPNGLNMYIKQELKVLIAFGNTYTRFYNIHEDQLWSDWVLVTTNLGTYNAPTAGKLKTSVKIWGNLFDGSKDIDGTIYLNRYVLFLSRDNNSQLGYVGRGGDDNTLMLGGYEGTNINIFAGGNPYTGLYVNNANNVGIGTTDPEAKLNIYNGQLKIESKNDVDTRPIGNSVGPNILLETRDSGWKGMGGEIQFKHLDDLNAVIKGEYCEYKTIDDVFNLYGSLNFYTRDYDTQKLTNRLIINHFGNVGIGTTDPQGKLDVNGDVYANNLNINQNLKGLAWAAVFKNSHNVEFEKPGIGIKFELGNTIEHGKWWGIAAIATSSFGNTLDLIFHYGKNSKDVLRLNSHGNVTIGESDLAGDNCKLYVDGISVFGEQTLFTANKYGLYIKGTSIMTHNEKNVWSGTLLASGTKGELFVPNDAEFYKDVHIKEKITSGDLVDWYGVSWSENDSDPTCTRIGNMALHRSLPILSAMKGYAICNRATGNKMDMIIPMDDTWTPKYGSGDNDQLSDSVTKTYTEIMVKIPEFWYIDDYEPSTKTHNLKISQTAKAGWCHHKEAYVGAYEGYNDGTYYRSTKGIIPTVSVNRETIRTKARANGYEDEYKWNIYTYEEHRAICHLFLVEYATRNSQAPVNTALTSDGFKQGGLGSGCTTGTVTINGQTTYSFIPTGTTDSLGNGSGQVAYTVTLTDADGNEIGTVTRYANRYRGIENPFGHIWKHVDDIVNIYNAETTYKTVYKCNKPEHFATNKNAKYKPLCSFPGGAKMQGWSKEIKATINCDFFKYSVGGSESTYWCDYNYDNDDTTEHCLLIGGYSGYGGKAGLFYFHLRSGVGLSTVSIGSRLTYLPWAE